MYFEIDRLFNYSEIIRAFTRYLNSAQVSGISTVFKYFR